MAPEVVINAARLVQVSRHRALLSPQRVLFALRRASAPPARVSPGAPCAPVLASASRCSVQQAGRQPRRPGPHAPRSGPVT